jgi:hypothetical protein
MPASVTLPSVADRFPVGTLVSAYLQSQAPGEDITGAAITTATVQGDGSLTFNGLVFNTAYVASATVAGVVRNIRFRSAAAGPDPLTRIWTGNGLVSALGTQAIGSNGQSSASTGGGPKSIPFDPADFPSARRLRFRAAIEVNGTPPATNVSTDLRIVTNTNGAVNTSVGAVLDAANIPALLDFGTLNALIADVDFPLHKEAVFNVPAALTMYLCRLTLAGAPAANAGVGITAQLDIVPDWYRALP